ncbi:oligopeptide/dipeptide ABC transporter ATP-binding protein [Bradyrhizobium sp. USDA 10063]
MSAELALMSLTAVAKAIAEKKVSSREVTRALLHRIAEWQPKLNAFMAIESEQALAAADEADAELAKGRSRGVLHGVPLAHKDMYYEAGKVVTCGSLIRRDFVAKTTATSLQRLKDAGSLRLGSLQMVEFAYGPTGHNVHYGPVHNPWNVDHITGGSSSGSGSAVAARLTFAALGSDTGGSIRMPAHFCGVTGLKTTVGRVSRAGAMPLSQSLDTVGPLAQTAEDCALLLGLMAGSDPEDPTASTAPVPDYLEATKGRLNGLKIGVPTAFYVDDLDAEVARILDETIAVLKREGAEIVKVELPDQRQLSSASQIVLAAEAAAFHKRWMIERPQDYGPQVLMRLQNGLAVPRRQLSRGDALARPGARRLQCRGQQRGRRDRARSAGAGPNDCRERRRQWPWRRGGDPAADALHPPGQLSRSAVAGGSRGLHPRRAAGRHATDRPLLRGSDAAPHRRGVPAGNRFPREGSEARMTNLVEIRDLNIRFTGERTVHAVNDLSLSLGEGEVLGLLGESGSGKSVTLRALMRLLPKKRTQISGSVKVLGQDVLSMDDEALSNFRGQTVSMIFQEPALALDPVYTIGRQIAETVMRHEGKSEREAMARALEMLEVVRIPSAKRRLESYPHEMSGGMRQRAMIALALACKPKILLADEPTTALDATVQIQILLLLRELQREFGMSVIFVTHDIGVAIEICDRVAVMYAGQIVEQGSLRGIVRSPVHPYAKGLLASTIHGARRGERLETIPGTPPSLDRAPTSCSFAPRCSLAQPRCSEHLPPAVRVAPDRIARCVLAEPAVATA